MNALHRPLRRRVRVCGVQPLTRSALVAALVGPPALAAALIPARAWLTSPNVALIMVMLVVVTAAAGGRMPGALCAPGAAVWFDYFHTRPYYSFTIDRHEDIATAALVLATGLVVGQLTNRSRRYQASARLRDVDLGRIRAVAGMLASGDDAGIVVLTVATELRELLGLRDCRFERSLTSSERAVRRIEADGTVTLGVFQWRADSLGLPAKGVDLVAEFGGHPYGRFILQPTPGRPIGLDRRIVAVALAQQAGAALAGQGPPSQRNGAEA